MEYFDPPQPVTLTYLLLKYLDDENAMSQLRKKASQLAEIFDWAVTAVQTWKA